MSTLKQIIAAVAITVSFASCVVYAHPAHPWVRGHWAPSPYGRVWVRGHYA